MVQGTLLLAYAAASIVALVLLIARLKLNPFVALVVVSMALGVAVGMPLGDIVKSFETGAGNALGHIAIVIALGTMLGKMMAESGGAERIAHTVIDAFGARNVHWAMAAVAFLVGIPVFFDVGFVLLVPIAFNVARRTGASMVLVGIPMVAGLSVVHGLVPPHPAALIAVSAYHADIGRTMLYALIVGLPTAALAGPLFARLVAPHVVPAAGSTVMAELTEEAPVAQRALPSFGVTVATILVPVVLMLVGNWADLVAPAGSVPNGLLRLAGTPVVALLLALLLSFFTLGRAFDRETILRYTNECLGPIAGVTLVIGAGAGFGRILLDGGVSGAVVDLATRAHVPALVLGWLVAALIRVATGSATVAMTTACGIVAPIAARGGASPELMVLATGAGSLILSHVNDGGFWLVKEYFGLTVPQTLKTWTVCETIIAVMALALTMLLAAVLAA
jgi:GntP family gluconate:H+ symporter